jgi:hypothetical protein
MIKNLQENILQDQLEEQIGFEQLSTEDKTKTQHLIQRLTRKLFKVTLSTLIAGVDEHQEDASSIPQEKLRKIKTVEALEQLVTKLESSDDETDQIELEALAEVA